MEWAAYLNKLATGGLIDAVKPIAEMIMRLVNYLTLHFSILRP